MSKRSHRGGALPLLILSLILFVMPGPAAAEIVLSEVLADAASDWSGDGEVHYKMDEWVEIANRGGASLDLSDYWLSDSVDEPVLRYRFSGSLSAGEALHVTGAEVVAWQAANDAGSAGLSLNNSGGEVALFHDLPAETVLADSVSYRAYQVEDDRTLGRYPLQSETWILFDGMNLYHGNQLPGSTGCMPSPSAPNVCEDSAPAANTSISSVKRVYPKDS